MTKLNAITAAHKIAAIAAAVVLFAPVAMATLLQAAAIVS